MAHLGHCMACRVNDMEKITLIRKGQVSRAYVVKMLANKLPGTIYLWKIQNAKGNRPISKS